MSLKVIGHINPDTDSTCSPIVYAWYLSHEKNIDATPYLSGEPNKEAQYVLKKWGVAQPEIISSFMQDDKIVVVDTNNPQELLPGIEHATIIEIVDHHKLAGLTTEEPPKVTMIPLACSSTVVWEIMEREGMPELPVEIAGLMLSAIISDTLLFTSPTTTDRDKEVARKLADIAKVDPKELAHGMFEAKSNLSGMSPKDIILSDSKVFDFNGKKARISVLETTSPEPACAMQNELLSAISEIKSNEQLDALFFFIVDIINNASTLLATDEIEKNHAHIAFGVESGSAMDLDGIVSRKKQMVPALEKSFRA